MILIAGAAMLIVVVVLVGLALGLTSSRPVGGALLVAVGGAGLFVLTVGAVMVAAVGLGGNDDEEQRRPAAAQTTASTVTTAPPVVTTTTRPVSGDLEVREVAVHANPGDDFPPPPSVVDRLPRRAVLFVTASGFEPFSTGFIEQCSTSGCGNAFPIGFPESGTARLQYLIDGEFSTSPGVQSSCRPNDAPCVVHVSSSGAGAFVTTVFGGSASPPPAVTVESPSGGFVDGEPVPVAVRGFVPGERVQAMLCAAPASHGAERCGAPGPVAPFTINADGTGHTALAVRRGRVGTSGVACGRETSCAIVVSSAGSFVPGPVAQIAFASGPAVTYDSRKVVIGVLLAMLLLMLASFLARTTDWRKPTEADTPELDRAVL